MPDDVQKRTIGKRGAIEENAAAIVAGAIVVDAAEIVRSWDWFETGTIG
ncbi:MAG: hypothetical protein HQM01_03190 [Magnetococcales bacterium]|nr:hypothetical protein [Magnetococcales bacterium]